ncbi:MAG: hypothetical protein GY720_15745 [bacterium]|nr:hypothetical protein [bacterium]
MSPAVEILIGPDLDELLMRTRIDVKALKELGYSVVGGIRYTTRGWRGKEILMAGPERDRVAVVTPPSGTAIWISSSSAENRRLVSRNSSFWSQPPWVLCNDHPSVEPRRLDEAHSVALEHVREVFRPVLRESGETIEDLAGAVGEYVELVEGLRLVVTGSLGTIRDDTRSASRIELWRTAEPPHPGRAD